MSNSHLLLVFGALLFTTQVGRGDNNNNNNNNNNIDSSNQKKTPLKIHKLTMESFLKEYYADRDGTKEKYSGEMIEITGTVHSLFQGRGHTKDLVPTIMVTGPHEAKSEDEFALFQTSDKKPWLKVGFGGKVTVRGQLRTDRFAYAPTLDNCTILSFKGDKYTTTTPSKLIKAISANSDAFAKKYGGKQVVVSGAVKANTIKKDGHVVLQGLGRVDLSFYMGRGTAVEEFAELKPGTKMTVLLELDEFSIKDKDFKFECRARLE